MTLTINRLDPALMPVDRFNVLLRVYRPLRPAPSPTSNGTAGQGTPKQSAIHCTALPDRCAMVLRAAPKIGIHYFDELPFPREKIDANRAQLCNYCFYGGPTKAILLI